MIDHALDTTQAALTEKVARFGGSNDWTHQDAGEKHRSVGRKSEMNSLAVMAFLAIPTPVAWSYFAGGAVLVIGLVAIFLRGDWQRARGFDTLVLFGPIFYAAPLAAFGTQHFTTAASIASLVPRWIPWHYFWTYFIGTCFIAAALSLVTGIQARLSASLLALSFFLFVALMDIPGWAKAPHNRFALALALRQLCFSGGALALAASLTKQWRKRGTHIAATVGRWFFAIALLVYSFEQFKHGNYVPVIPLNRVTPEWIYGHAIWTYLTAAVYGVLGIPLLMGKKARTAATWLGVTALFVELVVYVPIGVVEHTSLAGFNYPADTLMFGGAILLLASAMPRETQGRVSWANQGGGVSSDSQVGNCNDQLPDIRRQAYQSATRCGGWLLALLKQAPSARRSHT